MEQHAEILIGKTWKPQIPGWRDLAALILVLGIVILVGSGARQLTGPFTLAQPSTISLSPSTLPVCALRTTFRMFAALLASLLFTFTYATAAAKSRRAEMILIPLLDVLQSVPVLGYLSFTVVFFISLFPGSVLGPELAAIFAIFTSQAWNMTFSFYQSLRTIPTDLDEAGRGFRLSAWQRFWRIEVPFAMPGLIWNTMMSMSGGWFFVVASEAITVGTINVALPGIGSYVALAINQRNLPAVGWAILAMTITIVLYDQLMFRPMVAWADKFRYEQTAGLVGSRSLLLDLFRQAKLVRRLVEPFGLALQGIARSRFSLFRPRPFRANSSHKHLGDIVWVGAMVALLAFLIRKAIEFTAPTLAWADLTTVINNGFLTLMRVIILIIIASVIWVPIGVMVGLRPKLAEKVQPIAQFLAAFPANLLFPVAVFLILRFHLSPKVWLTPLMILGTQWYILFNVIAGASAFPSDLREAANCFHVRGWRWWRQVMLPGIFPYYVTGAITAAGGSWNASIVSEVVSWGNTKLNASGLGAYIAQATDAGDYPRIALGVAVMSVFVVLMNRLIWRPLYIFAERRTKLD